MYICFSAASQSSSQRKWVTDMETLCSQSEAWGLSIWHYRVFKVTREGPCKQRTMTVLFHILVHRLETPTTACSGLPYNGTHSATW